MIIRSGDWREWIGLAKESGFKILELARLRGTSIRQLERDLKRDLGRNPKEWLREQQMVAARYLLREPNSVKAASIELGFKQPSHFCREFKKVYGVTPGQYQAKEVARSGIDAFR